jgi:hypothetical protein
MIMLGVPVVVLALVQAITSYSGDVLSARQTAQSYAVAVCLAQQDSADLKDQGNGWAANIAQRDAFDPERYAQLGLVIKAQVARGDMVSIATESPPMKRRMLPVQYCSELIHLPAIVAAIDRAAGVPVERRRQRRAR